MGISGGDTGITTSAYHVNHVAENQAAGNPDGGSTATGQAAIAFESCTTTSCGFNVSVGPITFPSASIWNGSQTYTGNCPAEHNPNACIPKGTPKGSNESPDEPICGGTSPIIIDTTGHGFQLTSADDGVVFDIEGDDGHPIKLAWTAGLSGNAFLALPHNGKVTTTKELFGNYTAQPPCPEGGRTCLNGYRALAEFDKRQNGGNEDGIIDRRDAVFSGLVLWIDANHDGIAQPSELHTLPELGVYSINLKHRDDQHYFDQYGPFPQWLHHPGFRRYGLIKLTSHDLHTRRRHRRHSNRSPIAIRDAVARNRRNAISRNESSNQVQRIGSRQSNRCLRRVQFAHSPYGFHRNRQSKLFAHKTIDKAAAANLSAIFKPAKCHQQFAPGGRFDSRASTSRTTMPYRRSNIQQAGFHSTGPLNRFLGMQQEPNVRRYAAAAPRARFPARPAV